MSIVSSYGAGSLVSSQLDGLKVFLNITGAGSDDELAVHLSAAQAVVEDMLPAPLVPASASEVFPAGLVLVLAKAPVFSIDSVVASSLSAPLVVGTDVLADLEAGILRVQPTVWGLARSVITVVYTYGWLPLPPALRLAVFIVAGHLWETQRGAAALPMPGVDPTPTMAPAAGYAVPNRALELLAPYRRGPRI